MKMKLGKMLYDIAWAFTVAMLLRLVFGFLLGTNFPFVAVMSGSMTHDVYTIQNFYVWMNSQGFNDADLKAFPFAKGFDKGDALIIKSAEDASVGDVIVYVNPDLGYAIIHRIIGVNEEGGFVTKGDRNPSPDPWIVKLEWVKGKGLFLVPLVGWIRVLPTEIIYAIVGTKSF